MKCSWFSHSTNNGVMGLDDYLTLEMPQREGGMYTCVDLRGNVI